MNKDTATICNWLCFIVFLMIVSIAFTSMPGCTKPEEAKHILKVLGYEKVKITGYKFFGCGQEDTYHTGFTAIKNEQYIEGTVCEGLLFKNATVRFKVV